MPAIGAALAAIATTVTTAFASGGFFTTFVGRLLLSVALSALQAALVPKPREPGIKTKVTQTGGTNPQSFILGTYATAGTYACPPMSHGSAGKTPNAYLTYVILLSDVPGCALARFMVNNQYVTLGGAAHPDYGLPAVGDFAGKLWVKYYDGSQTVADPMLVAKYAVYPDRPWLADMIGRGSAYAIVTFRYDRKLFPSLPRCRFELTSIPVYDPRKDSTVGGSGAHRWADKSTWEASSNNAALMYNVLRGVELGDGTVWGGGFPAEDVPLATWFAAMNECDLAVSDGAGGTEPQFRAGLEVGVDEEPADILAELMKGCSGQIAEIGGLWKTRVGPPGLPVLHITDDDIVISKDQTHRPFPNFAGSYNGVHATYPDPEMGWESREAPPLYNATYEAADQGQRLIADLNLVAVPYGAQVRRLQHAYIEEERRFRRHQHTLASDAAILEPLDAISWTSAANGYVAKVFEVADVADDLQTALQNLMLKERDAADYSYPDLAALAPVSSLPVIPPAQIVPLFAVSGTSIPDASGTARRPALSLTWEPDLDDVSAISWEIRVQATGTVIAQGSTQHVAAGSLIIAQGIIAATTYEVRALPVVDRPSEWTPWLPATTPFDLITRPDISDGAVSDVLQTVALAQQSSTFDAARVFATLDMGFIPTGAAWSLAVQFEARQDITGSSVVELQSRYKFGGAPFTPWVVEKSWTVTGTTYVMHSHFGGLAGTFIDYEYRLTRPGSGNPMLIRNIYMTASRTAK